MAARLFGHGAIPLLLVVAAAAVVVALTSTTSLVIAGASPLSSVATTTDSTVNVVKEEVVPQPVRDDCAYWQAEYQHCGDEYVKDGNSQAYYKCIRLPVLAIQDDPTCSLPNEPKDKMKDVEVKEEVKKEQLTTSTIASVDTTAIATADATTSSVGAFGPDCLPTCQAVYANALGNCYMYSFLPVQYSACLLGAQQTLAACSAECMVPGGVTSSVEAKAASPSVSGDSFDCVAWGREQIDYAWTVCTTDASTLEACFTRAAQVWSKNYLDCISAHQSTPTVKVSSSSVAGRLSRLGRLAHRSIAAART